MKGKGEPPKTLLTREEILALIAAAQCALDSHERTQHPRVAVLIGHLVTAHRKLTRLAPSARADQAILDRLASEGDTA